MHSSNITTNNIFKQPRTSTVVHHGRRKGTLQRGSMADPFTPTPPVDQHKATVLPRLEGRTMLESVSNKKTSGRYTPVVQHGRRKGAIQKLSNNLNPPEDQHEVLVLSMSEWKELQDRARGVNREKERLAEAAREREAMFLRSKEASKDWPDSFLAQRQRLLEEKKLREQLEEEERRRIDEEEAKYQEMKRQEQLERARTLQFFQMDEVRELHSAFRLTEVLKEREAQIELKKRKKEDAKRLEKEFVAMMLEKDEQAVQQEQEKALEKKQKRLEHVESLEQQMREKQQKREIERKRERELTKELKDAHDLFIEEELAEKQKKRDDTRNFKLKAHEEHLAHKTIIQASEAERRKLEEDRCKFEASKDTGAQLRWRKSEAKKLQHTHVTQMAERHERKQLMKDLEKDFETRNEEHMKEHEKRFEEYSADLIERAREARRNASVLLKAARKGHRQEGLGLTTNGVIPRLPALNPTKISPPRPAERINIHSIKELSEATSLQDSKDRLGLSWQW